jgi:hypothetical protein
MNKSNVMSKRNDDPVHNVLNHLTEKFHSEEKARAEVRRMSLSDILLQNEYIERGSKQQINKMARRK